MEKRINRLLTAATMVACAMAFVNQAEAVFAGQRVYNEDGRMGVTADKFNANISTLGPAYMSVLVADKTNTKRKNRTAPTWYSGAWADASNNPVFKDNKWDQNLGCSSNGASRYPCDVAVNNVAMAIDPSASSDDHDPTSRGAMIDAEGDDATYWGVVYASNYSPVGGRHADSETALSARDWQSVYRLKKMRGDKDVSSAAATIRSKKAACRALTDACAMKSGGVDLANPYGNNLFVVDRCLSSEDQRDTESPDGKYHISCESFCKNTTPLTGVTLPSGTGQGNKVCAAAGMGCLERCGGAIGCGVEPCMASY